MILITPVRLFLLYRFFTVPFLLFDFIIIIDYAAANIPREIYGNCTAQPERANAIIDANNLLIFII